jgi:NitT/TauT family transport system permease protein
VTAIGEAPIGKIATGDDETWDEAALKQSKRKKFLVLQALRISFAAFLLITWELVSRFWIDPFWISRPSEIFERLGEWIADGTVARNLGATLQATLVGYFVGSLAGVVVGFGLGRSGLLAQVMDPFIISFYSLPKVALAPLFILWFGIGMTSKVVLTSAIVFFLVFYNTFAGVRAVDQDLVDVVRLMGGGRDAVLRRVVLPSSATWIFNGLKIAVPYALIGAVVGELTASDRGIGFILKRASGTFDTAGVFAALFILMIVATILNQTVMHFERHTARWKALPHS